MPPILLKPAEAARALRIGERTLWEKTQNGEIPAVNVGQGKERQSLRYLPEDLLTWARARRISSAEHNPLAVPALSELEDRGAGAVIFEKGSGHGFHRT